MNRQKRTCVCHTLTHNQFLSTTQLLSLLSSTMSSMQSSSFGKLDNIIQPPLYPATDCRQSFNFPTHQDTDILISCLSLVVASSIVHYSNQTVMMNAFLVAFENVRGGMQPISDRIICIESSKAPKPSIVQTISFNMNS